MARNLKEFYDQAQTEPAMTTVGRGLGRGARSLADHSALAAKNLGQVANELPKVAGTPMAGVANFGANLGANFMTGFTGKEYVPNQYEGKTFTQLLDSAPAVKPAAAAPVVPAAVAKPAAPVPAAPAAAPALPSISVSQSSSRRSVPDTGNSPIAQFYLAQQGEAAAPAAQPTSINVRRQPNGTLEFSGSGGGDGTGAVSYRGLPNWTSARGGAGQGSADFGGQAFKPAQAVVAQGPGNPLFERYQQLAEQVASGEGGIVGALQARSALRALAPLVERQMANENSLATTRMNNENSANIARMGAETTRRGQDLGLKGEMARVGASIYGTDVGAQTAREGHEIEKERTALSLVTAKAKASGNPMQVRQAQLLELEYAAKTGLDPVTGQPIDEALRKQLEQRIMSMKTPQTVVPYGGYGMPEAE